METYTNKVDFFAREVNYTQSIFGVSRTGIGLDSDIANLTTEVYASMLSTLKQYKIQELDIWHDEISPSHDFWQFLEDFLEQ